MSPSESRPVTVQDVDHSRPGVGPAPSPSMGLDILNLAMPWTIEASIDHAPAYWSRTRDEWLVDWIKKAGNDLLAGAHSTLVAKIASTDWYIEGPLSLAMLYKDILLNRIGWGAGWQAEVSMWVDAFLSRDFGGTMEALRSSATDRSGPALGFAHMDESKCYPTGIPEWPVIYYNADRGPIPIHQSQVCWITDMPDHRDKHRGVGFSAASRTLSTSGIMKMLVDYKQQSLSDLPPSGLLLLGNMTKTQWEDIEKRYDARQRNQGNTVWKDLMVAFSLDPAYPLNAEMIELSKLWEHFDERTATDIAMFSFALGYRVDAREYWPVSSGQLGTGMETEIMHRKAKAKGEGIIFRAIERQFNMPTRLPKDVYFRFDYQDTEEDKLAAEIRELHIQNVRRLWEASPNRVTAGTTLPPGEHGGSQAGSRLQRDEDANAKQAPRDEAPNEDRLGIISTEEARQLLVHWGVVPPEILGQSTEISRLYDVRSTALFGPIVRAHRDGRVTVMKRNMSPQERRAWYEYSTGR